MAVSIAVEFRPNLQILQVPCGKASGQHWSRQWPGHQQWLLYINCQGRSDSRSLAVVAHLSRTPIRHSLLPFQNSKHGQPQCPVLASTLFGEHIRCEGIQPERGRTTGETEKRRRAKGFHCEHKFPCEKLPSPRLRDVIPVECSICRLDGAVYKAVCASFCAYHDDLRRPEKQTRKTNSIELYRLGRGNTSGTRKPFRRRIDLAPESHRRLRGVLSGELSHLRQQKLSE